MKIGGWTDQFKGVYLVLGPSRIFWMEVASGGSYLACRGELGGSLLPPFCYKMAFGAEGKGFNTSDIQFSLKISEGKKKEGKNPSQGASVMLSWCFRDQFLLLSSPFFVRSLLFVDLQPVSFWFWCFEFNLCTLRGPFLLCMFSSSFFYFRYFSSFYGSFDRSFKS